MQKLHPLFDEYWAGKNADLSKITVPAFVVASWTDHGLHNRGTIEGFKQISSKDKWLIVHGRKKWWHFYQPENVEKQRQFFNRFLKGIDNHVKDWPRVTIEVREKYYVGETRTENEWPLARTQYTKYFLDAATASLGTTPPADEAAARVQRRPRLRHERGRQRVLPDDFRDGGRKSSSLQTPPGRTSAATAGD